MKRKLALLLAAVMAVTAFPMTALAASENSVTRQAVKAEDEVVLVEERAGLPVSGDKWSRIGHFKIVLKEDVRVGDMFKINLENAEFNFGGKIKGSVDTPSTETATLTRFLNDNDHTLVNEIPDTSAKEVKASAVKVYREGLESEISEKANLKDATRDVLVEYTPDGAAAETLNRTQKTPTNVNAKVTNIDEPEFVVAEQKVYSGTNAITNFDTDHSSSLTVFSGTTGAALKTYRGTLLAEVEAAIGANDEDAAVKVFNDGVEVTDALDDGETITPSEVTVEISYIKIETLSKDDYEAKFNYEFTTTKPDPNATAYTVADLKAWKTALVNELKGVNSKVNDVKITYNIGEELTSSSANTDVVQVIDTPITVVLNKSDSTSVDILAYDPDKGEYVGSTYTRTGEPVNSDDKTSDVAYALKVASSDTTATVEIAANAAAGSTILIPIVVILDGDHDEYRIGVSDSGNTTISKTSHVFASKADGKTKTYAKDTVTARSQFELKRIIIEEQKLGSIKDATFYLKAPNGYEFTNAKNVVVGIEPGLTGNMSYTVDFDSTRNKTDYSTLKVTVKGITPSTTIKGVLYLDKVILVAEDEENIKTGDVNLKIENSSSSTVFTEESFKVATASDYTIELKRTKDAIPTLVSGRLEGSSYYASKSDKSFANMGDDIADDYHKAARIKVSEKIPAAWWAERTTKLTLPEDVTILKAKFDKITNLDETSKTDLQAGTAGNATYYNTQKKVGKVTVDDNELTITNLKVVTDKKASFELDLWLGMAANFEGDIDLTLSGSAVEKSTNEEYPKVTIAKAIRPVEVKVDKVSEVQVGYQYFTVSDFSITETAAGNLLKGREVRVSITDGISIDMEIAKGFTAKVTEGDLKISNVTTSSVLSTRPNATTKTEGQITFEIDRESDEASTIAFSNVQVKVSRNVPYSNLSASDDRGIDLVVWGDAIAANYYQLDGNDEPINQNDLFTVPGVSAKYINVVTVANDASSEFKNTVKVTIGNPVIKINDQDFTMPVAAYVSTASNSTMVPVRFVANALGLADETVKWDDANKTVTVDAGTRIVQFQIGNTNYLVNGVSVPMVSPDGLPVAAEITSERAFIPFRALGEAFNVTVGWDAATSTATYNAAEAK
jgi:hypothetical protein